MLYKIFKLIFDYVYKYKKFIIISILFSFFIALAISSEAYYSTWKPKRFKADCDICMCHEYVQAHSHTSRCICGHFEELHHKKRGTQVSYGSSEQPRKPSDPLKLLFSGVGAFLFFLGAIAAIKDKELVPFLLCIICGVVFIFLFADEI